MFAFTASSAQRSAPDAFRALILGEFIGFFEQLRVPATKRPAAFVVVEGGYEKNVLLQLMALYNDRATSRVSDVSSIIARDAVIWVYFDSFVGSKRMVFPTTRQLSELRSRLDSMASPDLEGFLTSLVESGWGRLA